MIQNAHWMTYWQLCFPCDIKYDFVLKLESIDEDSRWFLDNISLPNISYPKGYSNSVDDAQLQKQLDQVPKDLVTAVYKYLETDYELFGYKKPKFVK